MQPPNPNLPEPYHHLRHHHATHYSYYSHLSHQNPNPNPDSLTLHHQYSSDATIPAPPVADPYFPPAYSLSHHHALAYDSAGVTYPQSMGAVAPANYAVDTLAQQYASATYAAGGLFSQDGTQQLLPAIPTPTMWTHPTVRPRGKKPQKKIKIAQSAWCEVCKVECNTKDVLVQHKLGKKHMKNLEKLKAAAATPAPAPAVTTVPSNPTIGPVENSNKGNSSNPIIGPMENPNKGDSASGKKKKKATETPADLEIKRRKVLEGGAAVNAVRTCTICNVVCNSDTVFRFHLEGQKHSSMLKKFAQGAGTVAN